MKAISGRSKTAFQIVVANKHSQKIRTITVENETWGYMTRGKKIVDMQVGKMFNCEDKKMQAVLLNGSDTSVLKFAITYHMTCEEDGYNIFEVPANLIANQEEELARTFKTLVEH